VCITFHPGVRPIATYLVRYFEPGWTPRTMGLLKAAFDSLCLVLTAGILAVLVTASVASNSFK